MPMLIKITKEYQLDKLFYDFLPYDNILKANIYERFGNINGCCFWCKYKFKRTDFVNVGYFSNRTDSFFCKKCADKIVKKNEVEIIYSQPRKV